MIKQLTILVAFITILAGIVLTAALTYDRWSSLLSPETAAKVKEEDHHDEEEADHVDLTPQAKKTMGLILRPVALQTHTRTFQLPGSIISQPGSTKVKISTPITGIVKSIGAFPGVVVKPGDVLFVLHLHDHDLQDMQSQLYKTGQEIVIQEKEQKRLQSISDKGVIAGKEMIQLGYELDRSRATKKALEQSLRVHHFSEKQIQGILKGEFVDEIVLSVPGQIHDGMELASVDSHPSPLPGPKTPKAGYEVEALNVHLGDQVHPAEVMCTLANHQDLYLEGRAFRPEIPLLESAIQNDWPVNAEILSESGQQFNLLRNLKILYIDQQVEKNSQTVSLYVPLTNEIVHEYHKQGRTYRLWKYRPGQQVYLNIPRHDHSIGDAESKEVFVLPKEAVVREGLETYVFRQNGAVLEPRPVQVLYADRGQVIITHDGSIWPGNIIAHNAAAQLMRVMKSGGEGEGGHGHHHDH
jgi:cobalt-zinc-cadmium efflux system membrane fusion protein